MYPNEAGRRRIGIDPGSATKRRTAGRCEGEGGRMSRTISAEPETLSGISSQPENPDCPIRNHKAPVCNRTAPSEPVQFPLSEARWNGVIDRDVAERAKKHRARKDTGGQAASATRPLVLLDALNPR